MMDKIAIDPAAEIGSREIPIVEFDHLPHDTYSLAMLRGTVNPISAAALDKLVRTETNAIPMETLQQVHHAQQIDAHNAAIDKKKADRKKLRQVAKQARVPLPVLKKVLASAKRQK